MKTFTPEEWKDLARGCRVLALQDEEQRKRNERSTIEHRFVEIQKLHLDMAARCESNAKFVSLNRPR